jgi:CheY-like chemotaxis protein
MSGEPHVHAVLVVDDDPGALDALVYYLESRGIDAQGAVGGEDALVRLRGGLRPCLVVTDVVMPWVDGWALVDAMRTDPGLGAIPVVMVSGHPEHVSRALQYGVRAYLPKPVEPGHVGAAVARYCGFANGAGRR